MADTRPPVAAEPSTWSGGYVGGSLGYAFGGNDDVGHRAPSGQLVASPGTLKLGGTNIGARIGWRDTTSNGFTYAFELGLDGGNVQDAFVSDGYAASTELKKAISLRLKPGVIRNSGDTVVYGIAGFVRGEFDYRIEGGTSAEPIRLNTTYESDGFVVGLGAEHRLQGNWSAFAELEYSQFDGQVLNDANGASTKATSAYSNLRVGLNFGF